MRPISCCLALVAAVWAPAAGLGQTYSNFCASRMVDYSPGQGNQGYSDPSWALDAPYGGGLYWGSDDVVTLGVQGSLTLAFDGDGTKRVIADGPGADFIVFENAILASGTSNVFGELIRVRVSSDGVHYVEFPTWCGLTTPIPAYGANGWFDPTKVSGFAGVHPVISNADNPTSPSPYDVARAGGDAFDLSALGGLSAVTSGLVDINRIRYVRLVDVLGDGSEHDSRGNPIYDPTGTGVPGGIYANIPASADVDAVAVVNGLVNPVSNGPIPGDANRDGVVNVADYLILKSNFGCPHGATWSQGDFNGDGYVDRADLALLSANLGKTGASMAGALPVPEPCSAALLAAGLAVLAGVRRRRAGA